MNWKTPVISLCTMLLGSGITWLVHTVVHGEQVHAAQADHAQTQDESIRDHEERTRKLESAFSSLAATDERLTAIMERLESKVAEKPRHR